ncbi:hypothetical protein [Sedimenticola selenatireducens]|uniref:Uncharacterized protein n=1 Tax=Sedimenticola selenatireducens TaxID=191960 RepID=A0A558E0F4_9GAMM|nr:hypothetical protein [Sedimenticola selenatireducens]TVO75306.1 hypothetical protein FHP88_09895 [Sedimenticola selenatireducens]TVT66841.1 MAG: hypothetical protein FHK78_00465 [Sedimenticola selenatireducens]
MKPGLKPEYFYLLMSLALTQTAYSQSGANAQQFQTGGAACVVAKKLGNSLAIQWATGEPSVSQAIDKAKQALQRQGYEYVFPQSNSHAQHGWIVIIKTHYSTYTGRERTSFGCGFDDHSAETAEQRALANLRSYSWGWKSNLGYEVIEKKKY